MKRTDRALRDATPPTPGLTPAGERGSTSRAAPSLDRDAPQALAQRRAGAAIDASPRMVAQRALVDGVQTSPHVAAQRQQIDGMLGADRGGDAARGRPTADQPARSNHTGLPDGLKAGIEALSGLDMSHVRVHENSPKPAQLNARAYAQGNEIHLGPGEERHLPHEAWHVVQQAQGRVRATLQMAGRAINDDAHLEREADRMGAQALADGAGLGAEPGIELGAAPDVEPGANPAPARVPPGARGGAADAPLQAVTILRNGVPVWENDPYVLQPGETLLPTLTQQPSVLVDEGRREVRFDSSGAQSSRKRKRAVPTHQDLQEQQEAQGAELRERLKQTPSTILSQASELAALAEELEKLAGSSVPSNHKEKIEALYKRLTGPAFRSVIKAQDEFTQSQASAAKLRGFGRPRSNTPPPVRRALDEYGINLLRVSSSLRAPTESIVAPIDDNGTLTGQQHPTSRSQPKLPGGSSGHSYADRARVEAQTIAHRDAIKDTNAPGNAVFLSSALSAVVSTLSGLSAPTSAGNLPTFHSARQEQQVEERERIKAQANLIAKQIGVPVNTDVQDYGAHWRAYETPTSPRRQSAKAPKLTPTSTSPTSVPGTVDTTTTPQTSIPTTPQITPTNSASGGVPSLPPLNAPIESVTRLIRVVQRSVAQLLAVIPAQQVDDAEAPFREYLAHVEQGVGAVDVSDAQNEQILANVLGSLNDVFHFFQRRRQISRWLIGSNAPGNATGQGGQRLPALQQFFAECGQMAAHNALVLATYPDLADPATAHALYDEGALAQLGSFDNNIDEDQIREIVTSAGRWDVPVIGSIAQVGTVLALLEQGDLQALQDRAITGEERQGGRAITDFMAGRPNALVMVLNIDSHLDDSARGQHWITVRVTRDDNGHLAIHYLDSLLAANDYSVLFQSLRQFLAQVPHQPVPAPGRGGHDFGQGAK